MKWQSIETAPRNREVWVTDGKTVVLGTVLGAYRTGWSLKDRMGWFGLTHWQDRDQAPDLPGIMN